MSFKIGNFKIIDCFKLKISAKKSRMLIEHPAV